MFKFFDAIVDAVQRVFALIGNLIEAMITAVSMVNAAVALPIGLVPYLPSVIGSCIVSVVAFGVVKFIIGR